MRKHENFNWSGYKYSPESVNFYLNGRRLNLAEGARSRIAYLVICERNKEALDELKRILRKEEKKPQVAGKCICFYKEGSDTEFYYTEQLLYNPDDLQDALRCYKEWKHYIQSKYCILETGYEIAEAEYTPLGMSQMQRRVIENKVDLTRCRSIKAVQRNIYGEV